MVNAEAMNTMSNFGMLGKHGRSETITTYNAMYFPYLLSQSNDFNAQVFSTAASFLRYNLLNFLNEKENCNTMGDLFQSLVDESATITYGRRLWDFFRGLFSVTISKIFDLFEIEKECSSYNDAFSHVLITSEPFQGCET